MLRSSLCFVGLLCVAASSAAISPRPVLSQPPAQGQANNPTALPDGLMSEGQSWDAYHGMREQADPLQKTDAAAAAYETFFKANPKLDLIVANDLLVNVAALYANTLKDTEKATQILDWGLEKYKDDGAVILMIEGKSTLLNDQKKPEEAEILIDAHWPDVLRAGRSRHAHLVMYASRTLQQYACALEAENKPEKSEHLRDQLAQALVEMPALFDDRQQSSGGWFSGWMYEKLVELEDKAGHKEAALGWARLYFAEAAFESKAIERATKVLARQWGQNGQFPAVRAFAAAQTVSDKAGGEKVANPLLSVPLPPELLQERLELYAGGQKVGYSRERSIEQINLLIAANQLVEAMRQAERTLTEEPLSQQGAQEVARVFKAHDGSIARSNQFLAYLEGQGQNPLPQFYAEMQREGIKSPTLAKATEGN